jgi:predicted kinase
MIVVVFGLPGSGKSYFAQALAAHLNCPLISSDATRKQLSLRGKYDEKTKNDVYLQMLFLLEVNIKNAYNLVLDATFYKARIRNQFKEKAMALGAPIYFIEIRADENTIKGRVSRKRQESEADLDAYVKVKQEFEPLEDDHLVLYSDLEKLDKMLAIALEYLNNRGNEAK